MQQIILNSNRLREDMDRILKAEGAENILLVCGTNVRKLALYGEIREMLKDYNIVEFSDFSPNPKYEAVVEGVKLFNREQCNFILAIGGGSALDVAKCIKLFVKMDPDINYLQQTLSENRIPFMAIPTTAGTGSEATRFAVIYYNGIKQSVSHESCIPKYVAFIPSVLESLPKYQKKSTLFDALCHALESFWSVNSTEDSKSCAIEAIDLILRYHQLYMQNDAIANDKMLEAANLAGKAINIAQTTAGHAMCYKLMGLYGISHGHAAALCVAKLWPYMLTHIDRCVDNRGQKYLQEMFEELAGVMHCQSCDDAVCYFQDLLKGYEMSVPNAGEYSDITLLCDSVNLERMQNNPIAIEPKDLEMLYRQILNYDLGMEKL